MLDDQPVGDAEDIAHHHPRIVAPAADAIMQDDMIAIDEGALQVMLRIGVARPDLVEKRLQRVAPRRGERAVLDVIGGDEAIDRRGIERHPPTSAGLAAAVNSSIALVAAALASSSPVTTILPVICRVVRGGRARNAARIAARPAIGASGALGRVITPSSV